jgi:hypothetical protein
VAELPTPQRVAVVLRHVAGLPIAEIAAVRGCPEGTAKSHVSRGLRRLRSLCRGRQFGGVDVGEADISGTGTDAAAPRNAAPAAVPRHRAHTAPPSHADAAAEVAARRER